MYYAVLSIMKIRILKNCLVEIEKKRLQETWDKQLYRGNELHIDSAIVEGKWANLTTYDGDVIQQIATDAFEVIK
jgi:hypothetical protein